MTPNFSTIVRWLLAGVFLYAGVNKVFDPAAFTVAVDHYRLVPRVVANGVALYLPWLEIVCAAGLLWSKTRMGALAVLSALSIVFASAIGSAMARGLDIECGCFGAAANQGGNGALTLALLRSLLLTWACGWLVRVELIRSRTLLSSL